MTLLAPATVAAMAAVTTLQISGAATTAGQRCEWTPPVTGRSQVVRTAAELVRAAAAVRPDTTILLEPGEYRLPRTLNLAVPDTVLRSARGDRDGVVIRGGGMTEGGPGVALSVSAPRVTIADVTIGWVAFHGIQVHGEHGASHLTVHNVRIADTGQQLLKGSISDNGRFADDGLIACSLFEYTTHAPGTYTNGIDVLAAKGWTVRDSEFRRIRGPADAKWSAGPAILFWANSQDTVVERNVIVDSFRGIALGLGPGASSLPRDGERRFDHQRGVVRNNAIVNLSAWADEGIEANAAAETTVEQNTVLVEGQLGWSISLRFPTTTGSVRRNLTNRRVFFRNGGTALVGGNVETADRGWFLDAAGGNLRIAPRAQVANAALSGDVGVQWGPQ